MATLAKELQKAGFADVLGYDPVAGFRVLTIPADGPAAASETLAQLGLQPGSTGVANAGLELFAQTLERVVTRQDRPIALIADFASRLVIRNDSLTAAEQQVFTRALVLAHQARARPLGTPPRPFFNSVIWVVEKEGDLPDWLLVDNPRIRHVPVAKPDHQSRRTLVASLLRALDGFRDATPEARKDALDAFVEQTEGLLLVDLTAIAQLGRSDGIEFSKIGDAVRRYKVGVTDDPWARIDRNKIRLGADFISSRVKGQPHAVAHTLDIVKRAVTGIGAPGRRGRPRGVLFLAGPTGVGKTELAKTLTSLLFGDDSAYIRFDMSEFSAEHSDQRLIGAPPGYVGYDVGGELTNAIREKPFSVVLFDEIEKAHPRILDKFLQVLDDGVLTSGRGDRVYFSEAFIVFTSNLGIYRLDDGGARVVNVSPEDGFADVRGKVREEIEHHFKTVLNRPEILNRIGDNILVFDFIRPKIAMEIFDSMVARVLSDVALNQHVDIALDESSRTQLQALCLADLSNGGRGIRNKVETHLVNPLARAFFECAPAPGSARKIKNLSVGADGVTTFQLTEIAGGAKT
jgi:ATP-dependent Clp protease ATP-binding subunit ClpA